MKLPQRVTLTVGARGSLCWLWAVLTLTSVAASGTAPLTSVLAPTVKSAHRAAPELGVHVVALRTGETVFEHRADVLQIVASNTKLATSAAALDLLGPGYFFETPVLIRGSQNSDSLLGDLAVVGDGDPNISGRHFFGDPYAVFRRWAAALSNRGIRRIEGSLFLIHGLFEPVSVHPDWPEDQLSRWYEAPVAALSFNDNCLLVRVWPGSSPGTAARVETRPGLSLFEIRNHARTTTSRRQHRVIIDREPRSHQLHVDGALYRHAGPVESCVTVPDPVEYFGAAVRAAFAEEQVFLAGRTVTAQRLPAGDWQQVTVHRSDLLTTIEVLNKQSQNFYAESLLKHLAASRCGEGSWRRGIEVVGDFLHRAGLQPGSFQLADGSGLSRGNRFSPREITRLLRYMFHHRWGQEFVRSLPHSGEEETRWEGRLAVSPYRGNVFAKTGSLRGVSALSGYAKGRSGEIYAFSILCNRTRGRWEVERAQDRIVQALIDHG